MQLDPSGHKGDREQSVLQLSDRHKIGAVFGEMPEHERRHGRPLLPAVVTHKDGIPGKGFFTLARELGLLKAGQGETIFWADELRHVHDSWSGGM